MSRTVPALTFAEFEHLYLDGDASAAYYRDIPKTLQEHRQRLLDTLQQQVDRFHPDGWMLLQCEALDSSKLGSRVILPYGGDASYKTPPLHPISPRGLASDMSVVIATLPVAALPETLPFME